MEVSGLPSFMAAAGSRDHCLWSGAGTSNCHVICHSESGDATWQLYLTESIIYMQQTQFCKSSNSTLHTYTFKYMVC